MEANKIEAKIEISQAQQDAEHALALSVTNADEYRVATETLKQLVNRQKTLEEQRKRATKPLDEAKKEIMGWYKPALEVLERVISKLRFSLGTYSREQAAREVNAIEAFAATGDKTAMVSAFAEAAPEVEGTTTRVAWKYEITDLAALPREFLIPDTVRIGQIVRAMKQDTAIPGVRAFSETIIAVGKE